MDKNKAPTDGLRSLGKWAIRLVLVLVGTTILFGLSGCACFNSNMGDFPDRRGAPPYDDDPEANGNPAKAWYN